MHSRAVAYQEVVDLVDKADSKVQATNVLIQRLLEGYGGI